MLELIYTAIENVNAAHTELHKEESGRTDNTNSFAQITWSRNLTFFLATKVVHVVIALGSYSACYIYTFVDCAALFIYIHTVTVHIVSR